MPRPAGVPPLSFALVACLASWGGATPSRSLQSSREIPALGPSLMTPLDFRSGIATWKGPLPGLEPATPAAIAALGGRAVAASAAGAASAAAAAPAVGDDQFRAALSVMAEQNVALLKQIDGGADAAASRSLGLSVFDRQSSPARAQEGPVALNTHEAYSAALVSYGAPQEAVKSLVQRLPFWHRYQPSDSYHGPLFAVRSANLMAYALERADAEDLGRRKPKPEDKAQLVVAALLHKTDSYSGRTPGASPTMAGTLYFLKDEPYLASLLDKLRYGQAPLYEGRVPAFVALTDPQLDAAGRRRLEDVFERIDSDRPGFAQFWGRRLDYVSRVCMFVDGVEFAREAVRARAKELQRDALSAARGPGPSDAEVFLSAAAEVKALAADPLRSTLGPAFERNLLAVSADFDAVAAKILAASRR